MIHTNSFEGLGNDSKWQIADHYENFNGHRDPENSFSLILFMQMFLCINMKIWLSGVNSSGDALYLLWKSFVINLFIVGKNEFSMIYLSNLLCMKLKIYTTSLTESLLCHLIIVTNCLQP